MTNLRTGGITAQKTRELSQWDMAAIEDMVARAISAHAGIYHGASLLALFDKLQGVKHMRVSYASPKTF